MCVSKRAETEVEKSYELQQVDDDSSGGPMKLQAVTRTGQHA